LEFRPLGLLGLLGEPVSAPYDCISHRIEGDQFLLFLRDEKRAACRERVDGANFFVGLAVLDLVCRDPQELRLPAAGERAPGKEAVADDRVTPGSGEGVQQRAAEKDLEP